MRLGHLVRNHIPTNVECGPDVPAPHQLLLDSDSGAYCVQPAAIGAPQVFRGKLILMLAEGAFFNLLKRRLQTSAPTIIRWKQRFLQFGLDGLDTYHPATAGKVPALQARVLVSQQASS
jgi:hypothetical protein